MRILVTGGTGFVGQNAVELLSSAGHEILSASRRTGLDLTDFDATRRALRSFAPEVILNCAAHVGSLNFVSEHAAVVADLNLRMLLNIFRAVAETCPRTTVINPVANCAFPGQSHLFREDELWLGELHSSVYSYGSTRRMMIVLSDCYRAQFGVRSINFFVPNMYGPYDSTDPNKAHALNALVSKIVRARAENAPELEVWGTGSAVREWLYAPDFARVVLLALPRLEGPEFARPLNIAQQDGWSVRDLVTRIVAESGYRGRIAWDSTKPDGAPHKVMERTRFRSVFPQFRFTEFGTGIAATLRYYESIYPYSSEAAGESAVATTPDPAFAP
ncbi:MAG: NAD-dependent epimerase/dehydratase family protein [Planctomycetota bacterium]